MKIYYENTWKYYEIHENILWKYMKILWKYMKKKFNHSHVVQSLKLLSLIIYYKWILLNV
jgi:hypothetical protein